MIRILLTFAIVMLSSLAARAQDAAEEAERSYFVSYVESQLSTPDRQFRINGISGALSSNATIQEITIADREGVWLRVTNARIVWTRSQLFLGRLQINALSADRIDVLRAPVAAEDAMPSPEATTLEIPELPIEVAIDQLAVPVVTFGETVFGLASQISAGGHLRLAGGSLDTALAITRLDGPGGQLALTAVYTRETEVLNLDFSINEPANGIVANVLGVEGRPPMALTLRGAGPLGQLDLALTLDAGSQRVLTGATQLRRLAEGLGFSAKVSGPIATLISPRFRDFFGAESNLTATGLFKTAGGTVLEQLDLTTGALTISAAAETAADGWLERLKLDAQIGSATSGKVVLPVPGGATTITGAKLAANFGEQPDGRWNGSLFIDNLSTDSFGARTVSLSLDGLAERLTRRLTFALTGAVSDIEAVSAAVAEALGNELKLEASGAWTSGQPLRLDNAAVSGNGLSILLSGDIAEFAFAGNIAVKAANIAPFSGFAGRNLSGSLDIDAKGDVAPISGAFDLSVDGLGTALAIDSAAFDNLLAGETRITGGLERGPQGIVARQLRLYNQQFSAEANGNIATGAADFAFDLDVGDLALLSDKAGGRLVVKGRALGSGGPVAVTASASIVNGSLVGKTLTDALVAFDGTLLEQTVNGELRGNAALDGVPVTLSAHLSVLERETRLNELQFSAGQTRISGGISQHDTGLLEGQLALASTDISTAAALALVEAEGSLNADITLTPRDEQQDATIQASANGLTVGANRVGTAKVEATIADLFGVPMVNGTANASNLTIAGIAVDTLKASADHAGTATNFTADARLDNGATAALRGALETIEAGYRVRLDTADLEQGKLSTRLVEPAVLTVQGENLAIENLVLDAGGGRVSVRGGIAEKLDLSVSIAALPLAIANAVRPDLGLAGTIDGTATITGTKSAPNVAFKVKGKSIAAAALQAAGLRSVDIDAQGSSSTDTLTVQAALTSPQGLQATLNGTVPLTGGTLALDANLKSFPLALLNTVAPGQALAGTISGNARVAGTLADPAVKFDLAGTGIAAAPLNEAGLAPLTFKAAGAYARQVVTLSSASASGPQGLTLAANGRVALTGNGTNINVTGSAPLSLAQRFLSERGTQLSGTATLSASISGSLAKPSIRGTISTRGAALVDPGSNVRLSNIAVTAELQGDRVVLQNASAAIAGGGSIGASGSISLAGDLPANIAITLNDARYADGNLVVATLSGRLALTGSLRRDPLLSGNLTISRAEITVPETLGGNAAMLDVKHIRPPKPVAQTLRRAKASDGTAMPSARPSVIRLDISIDAPNRIFVRGRGLDAELGGSVRLTGPVTSVQPVGGFRLIRGRLSILGQRITFDEGTVSLVGDLDPFLNFVARSSGSDITVFITVSGRISDLDITFSSQPELPQDEVLARLIFKRGINELSAFQVAQLAAAAAELVGGGGSLLGKLRAATGLDDLDVVTNKEGGTAVRAGRYIQDNIYLGIEAGGKGSTRATINLDITDNLKARGSVGADGDTGLGVFFEKDY